jgi:O-antigen/teichoic acid export membrane protein
MSLHRALAHSTILQIVGKSISTVLGFVAIAIMTRTLGVAQFGWYITASGFLQFVGIISDFGFTVTTSNMLAETRFDRTKLLNTLFTWRIITAVVIQGLAPLVFLLFPYSTEIKLAVGILTASFFALTMQQICLGYYRERLQMRVPTFADVLARLLLVFGVALAAYTRLGFFAMMGAITLASRWRLSFFFRECRQYLSHLIALFLKRFFIKCGQQHSLLFLTLFIFKVTELFSRFLFHRQRLVSMAQPTG